MTSGQIQTRAVYEDETIVRNFAKKHAANPLVLEKHLHRFITSLPGNRVLDVGCGAGRDTLWFARQGLRATGIDYSEAMIRSAQRLSRGEENAPFFAVVDMRAIEDAFPANSFDGTWVSASLIHVPEREAGQVLQGLHHVLKPSGRAHIALKGGTQGAALITEEKYGKSISREFIFWEAENFEPLLTKAGFVITDFRQSVGGETGGIPTTWLRFDITAVKPEAKREPV